MGRDGGSPSRAAYCTALHWTCLVAQMVKNLPAMWETWVGSLSQEDSPGEGNGNPLQYSCLKNPMNRGARWATDHGVTMSRTRLSDFHIHSFITLDAKDWFMRISEQVGVYGTECGELGIFELLMLWYMMFLVGQIKASCLVINKALAFASVFIGCVVF